MPLPAIETARLRLAELDAGDAAFILALLNDPDFLRHIGDRGVRTLEDAGRYIDGGPVQSYQRHGFGLMRVEIRETSQPAGMCGLIQRPFLPHPDIGYAFLPAFRGRAYAREAAATVLADARERLGIHTVLAIVNPDNQRSIRLLEQLGMSFERRMTLPDDGGEVSVYRSERA